jgi:hypothetical protein
MPVLAASLLFAVAGAALVPPAPADEPDPPKRQEAPIECVAPDEVPPDQHLVVRCSARAGLPPAIVLLYYRPHGAKTFTPAPTLHTTKGWYTATLCPHMMAAGPLHYYVEARTVTGQVVGKSGDDWRPAVLQVLAPASLHPAPAHEAEPVAVEEIDPLAPLRARHEADRLAALRRGPGAVFVGLTGGFGYGFYPTRVLDFRRDVEVASGSGAAGPLVLAPEIGYQLSARLALSVEGRWESIAVGGAGDPHQGSPATSAWAVLVRASGFWGSGRAQLVLSGALGAGDGIRVVVPPSQATDIQLNRTDSVRGGPLVLGPGVGFAYHFGPHLAYRADVRALAGLPDFATVVDLTTGLEVGF